MTPLYIAFGIAALFMILYFREMYLRAKVEEELRHTEVKLEQATNGEAYWSRESKIHLDVMEDLARKIELLQGGKA